MIKVNELRLGNYIERNGVTATVEIINGELDEVSFLGEDFYYADCSFNLQPSLLTEEWLLKFGFENWGKGKIWNNDFETYDRFVLYNVLDGTSNFEVHFIKSTYGNSDHYQYVISCDEGDRIHWGKEIINVHQLQNLYFSLTGEELTTN